MKALQGLTNKKNLERNAELSKLIEFVIRNTESFENQSESL